MGIKAMEMNAKVELAQPTPRFLYIADANRGCWLLAGYPCTL